MAAPVQLFHRDLGGKGNPPLLVLHGMLGSSRNWLTAGRELSTHYHVHALDLRNHGASPHDAEMNYPAMLADVLAWLAAREIKQVTIIGHSMGGKVAMLLACRQPALVKRLIVLDIAPKDYFWVGHRAEFAAMRELQLEHLASRAEAELRFEARVDDWSMRKFLTTNLDRGEDGRWRWLINLPALIEALPVLEKNPLATEDHFDGPTLFVTGERSTYVSTKDHEIIHRHFPKAVVTTIAKAGHNPHMDQREAFVRSVLESRA